MTTTTDVDTDGSRPEVDQRQAIRPDADHAYASGVDTEDVKHQLEKRLKTGKISSLMTADNLATLTGLTASQIRERQPIRLSSLVNRHGRVLPLYDAHELVRRLIG